VLYLIYCAANGLTKIGTSGHIGRRFRDLCNGSPVDLELTWTTVGDQGMMTGL
jgi:hypothetical protein